MDLSEVHSIVAGIVQSQVNDCKFDFEQRLGDLKLSIQEAKNEYQSQMENVRSKQTNFDMKVEELRTLVREQKFGMNLISKTERSRTSKILPQIPETPGVSNMDTYKLRDLLKVSSYEKIIFILSMHFVKFDVFF